MTVVAASMLIDKNMENVKKNEKYGGLEKNYWNLQKEECELVPEMVRDLEEEESEKKTMKELKLYQKEYF